MGSLTDTKTWKALQSHYDEIANTHMRDLFAQDDKRFEKFSLRAEGMLLDYSKNRVTDQTMTLLRALAEDSELKQWIERMFAGDKINVTEDRAVLHTALRQQSDNAVLVDGHDVMPDIRCTQEMMHKFANAVRSGELKGCTGKRIRSVVNIGIGGSDLGPAMVVQALQSWQHAKLDFYFVSNVDPHDISSTLQHVEPELTLFIIASKTFTTQETMVNANTARKWFVQSCDEGAIKNHFVAVSSNMQGAENFGVDSQNIFPMWDWVGGRYSLWSAIGLPIALSIGMDEFENMLAGAAEMDDHFRNAPLQENIPITLALLGIWYANFFNAQTHAVVPYDQGLARFPAFVQQLDMESNGKSVTRDGEAVDYTTGPVIWGEPGTNAQHAFFQLLHQGKHLVPVDFIVAANSEYENSSQHKMLLANYLAQTDALMTGKNLDEASEELRQKGISENEVAKLAPHKTYPGNQPSNSIVVERLDPRTLGSLIAMYEHKVFVQGIIWRICSFDQWGVELGKQLAGGMLGQLEAKNTQDIKNEPTRGLMEQIIAWRSSRELD
ncbi:MAG: glucose-6-phosphate isomerase [Gammaproteobacteria bacterium]|nr:glucose-6-phosphate isomerase [Gammaproteobacteria bacterium]